MVIHPAVHVYEAHATTEASALYCFLYYDSLPNCRRDGDVTVGISVSAHRKSGNKLAGLSDTDTCQESFICLVKVVLGYLYVRTCMNNVCTHVITVYLIAVETKMYLEMLHMEKHRPSTDQA